MTRLQHCEFLFFLNFSASHTHPRTGVLLNSRIFPPAQLWALIFLHRHLFVTIPVAPCAPTPPPAPSEIPQEGPWIITPNDITAPPEGPWSPDDVPQPSTSKVHNTPDYGMPFHLSLLYFIEVGIGNITWLFQDDFCDFASVHLGFTPLHLQLSRRLLSKAPAPMSSFIGVQHVLVVHVLVDHWKRVTTFMLPWMATSITDISVLWATARRSITHNINISFQRPNWMPSGDTSSMPADVPQSSLNPQYLTRPSINAKLRTRLQMAISKRWLWTILMIRE